MPKHQERPMTPEAAADRSARLAREGHEAERQAYLATLDPRQRPDLKMAGF